MTYFTRSLLGILLLVLAALSAQAHKNTTENVLNKQITVSGTVTDESGEELPGVSVKVKGTAQGTVTSVRGKYSITVEEQATLVFSYVGYASQEVAVNGRTTLDVMLASDEKQLSEVLVTGSRSANRTVLETTVPVDVIHAEELALTSPQVNVNQLLNYVAPSFSSNTQTISDGTDHIDPASLRGLGPDQVLVLINGKRRHNSSLVNVNGTFGRGSVGTDLNTIPVAAIKRIEVLRDGAAAQYGSDAIAGVINIILKDEVNRVDASLNTGAYVSKNSENGIDGLTAQVNGNYGLPLGNQGGFVNFTASYQKRGYTNRMKAYTGVIFRDYNDPALYPNPTGGDITEFELAKRGLTRSDFNMRVGQSALDNVGLMMNMQLPVNEHWDFYAFGGWNYRKGVAGAFYRLPFQARTVTSLYTNGFLPLINSHVNDGSLAAGIKGKWNEWRIDFSNTFGSNGFRYQIENTSNASMLDRSPTSFNAGGFNFLQNTTNFDMSRYYQDILQGFNLAFGAEYRLDNYQIFAGDSTSYTNYGLRPDASGKLVNTILTPVYDSNKKQLVQAPRPGGSQGFPGFSSKNALNQSRSSVGLYVDTEADVTDWFTLTAALRFENYSDFGATLNWKTSLRATVTDWLAVRGAVSTGFRAPSLQQQYFNSTGTQFIDGVAYEVGTFTNTSQVAQLLGIPKLKQETSQNYSVGLTGQIIDNLSFTVDAYLVNITDRIVYTGRFAGKSATDGGTTQEQEILSILTRASATQAAFFANAIDTRTQGIDLVLTYDAALWNIGTLKTSLAATFAQTVLDGAVKTSPLLAGKESTYFDQTNRIFLESAVPRTKVNLTLDWKWKRWGAMLRNVYFGPVNEATNEPANQQTFSGKVVTDLSVDYKINEMFTVVIGSSNLFDIYPDMNKMENQSGGRFLYSRRSQQFGANGRFLFARAVFTLDTKK